MKIAVVASEAAPFVKTGGLGDVMQALPLALSKQKTPMSACLSRITARSNIPASGRQNF